jgi:uracil-DNA glycosylase
MLDGVSQSWIDIMCKSHLERIEEKINVCTPDEKLCPPKNLWFEWARLTPLESVKIIIIGQDPYYDPGTAHGLAFSSLGAKIPPSLQNIYKCLKNQGDIKSIPKHANLTKWAQRGVLLLNAALSTEEGVPAKHSKIWNPFIGNLISEISNYGKTNEKKYMFLLWGNFAKAFKKNVDTFHDILEWIHPSPMAQIHVTSERKFINCNHFYLCTVVHHMDWSLDLGFPEGKNDHDAKVETDVETDGARQITVDPDLIQVFTDGSCKDNGKESSTAGFAAIFVGGVLKGKRLRGKISKNASNIRAEGKAIICVLERLQKIDENSWKKTEIYTDSEFWIKMIMTYMPKWDDAKFAKQKNPDMTKKIWGLWNSFAEHELELIWVPAHNKLGWETSPDEYKRWCFKHNDAADKLANLACNE